MRGVRTFAHSVCKMPGRAVGGLCGRWSIQRSIFPLPPRLPAVRAHDRLFAAQPTPEPVAGGVQSLAGRLQELAPGVAAAALISEMGCAGAEVAGAALLSLQGLSGASPVSGIPVAILLGLGLNNSAVLSTSMTQRLAPGLAFCKTTVLQTGIVCIGAKLSAVDILTTGRPTSFHPGRQWRPARASVRL